MKRDMCMGYSKVIVNLDEQGFLANLMDTGKQKVSGCSR